MQNQQQRKAIMEQLGQELLSLLQRGDVHIVQEVTYFEDHTNPARARATSLYALFESWAKKQNPPVEPTDRNFYKVLFNTMSRLNAKQKIQVRVVAVDCSLCVLLNPDTYEV